MQKRNHSFTLIELLVVIAIIAVLAALAFSVTTIARKRATDAKIKSRVQDMMKAWVTYSTDSDKYQDQCGADIILETGNVVGSPSLTEDFMNAGAMGKSFDATGIYVASSPVNGCVYTSGRFTAIAIATGAQLTTNAGTSVDAGIYPNNTSGNVIQGIFDTPNVGSLPWFVKAQQ